MVAMGSASDGVLIFDVASGEQRAQLPELGNLVASLDFSPDGSRLAGANSRGPGVVWETTGWAVVDDQLGAEGPSLVSLRYSPSAPILLTMDVTGEIAVRDAETGAVDRRLVGSGSPDIAEGVFLFASDGHYVLSNADGQARLWDLRDGVAIGDPFPNDSDEPRGGGRRVAPVRHRRR